MKKTLILIFTLILLPAFGLTADETPDDQKKFHKLQPCNDGCGDFEAERDDRIPDAIKKVNIVKESPDATYCGAASLAMLINSFDNRSFSEQEVEQGLWEHGDQDKIRERGSFSLLDMKKYLTAIGYESAGYKAWIESLKELDRPAIVPIKYEGSKYSPILEGIDGDDVYLADPCLGYRRFSVSDFEEIWSTVCFLIKGKIAADKTASMDSPSQSAK